MMRDFLTDSGTENAVPEVDLKVMLPDQSCLTVKIERNQQTKHVLDIVLRTLQISTKFSQHFGLFETVENNFGKF